MIHLALGTTLSNEYFVDDSICDVEGFGLDYLKRRWCSGLHTHPLSKKVLGLIAGLGGWMFACSSQRPSVLIITYTSLRNKRFLSVCVGNVFMSGEPLKCCELWKIEWRRRGILWAFHMAHMRACSGAKKSSITVRLQALGHHTYSGIISKPWPTSSWQTTHHVRGEPAED